MLATPEIIETNIQEAAVIRLTIPRSEMMKVFGPAVSELMAALAAQGAEPVGAVFAHHLKMSPDTFDFELGVKVSAPVKATGRETGPASCRKGGAYRVQWSIRRPPFRLG
jgi:hypothetical protein